MFDCVAMNLGGWISFISPIAGTIIGIAGLVAGWIYYRNGRRQAANARQLTEQGLRTSRNLAQTAERNLGFDYLTAWIDVMQYGMCRNNTGCSEDKLSEDEHYSLREYMVKFNNTGIALLQNSVTDDHARNVVEPALAYIEKAYLATDDLFGPGPSVSRYEAGRLWLVEARRVCNELAEDGAAKAAAEDVERKIWAAHEDLDRGLTQKMYDPVNEVAFFAGPSVEDMLERDLARAEEFLDHLPVCRGRLRIWKEKGLLADLQISDDLKFE